MIDQPDDRDWPRPARRPLVAVVSSRLGRDSNRHRRIAQFLFRSAAETKRRGGTWLVATDSAIDPWARRAAQLYEVPILWLTDGKGEGDIMHRDQSLGRDEAVIAMADRVDAVYIRSGGKIHTAIHRRLQSSETTSVRIAIWPDDRWGDDHLIQAGAIGWYLSVSQTAPVPTTAMNSQSSHAQSSHAQSSNTQSSNTQSSAKKLLLGLSMDAENLGLGPWLVHSTRAVHGPWPGETIRQYQDSVLLSSETDINVDHRQAIDTLTRIIRSRKLIASAVASSHRHRVVCFSACPLFDLIQRRMYRSHLGRWDYEPYGFMIRKSSAIAAGARPVIYGEKTLLHRLPDAHQYRFHPLGKTYDWRQEREWRFDRSVDLSQFDNDDIRVFCLDNPSHRELLKSMPWKVIWVNHETAGATSEASSP
jgi:hypothetical protein